MSSNVERPFREGETVTVDDLECVVSNYTEEGGLAVVAVFGGYPLVVTPRQAKPRGVGELISPGGAYAEAAAVEAGLVPPPATPAPPGADSEIHREVCDG